MVEYTTLTPEHHNIPDTPRRHFWRIRLDTDSHTYTLQLARRGILFTHVVGEAYIEKTIQNTAEGILEDL